MSLLGIGGEKLPNKKAGDKEDIITNMDIRKETQEKSNTTTSAPSIAPTSNEAQVGSSGPGKEVLDEKVTRFLTITKTTDVDAASAYITASKNDTNVAIVKYLEIKADVQKYLKLTGTTDVAAAVNNIVASHYNVNDAILKCVQTEEIQADVTKQNLDISNYDGSVVNRNEVTQFNTPTSNTNEIKAIKENIIKLVRAKDIDGAKRLYLKAVEENQKRTPSWATDWSINDHHDIDKEIMCIINSEILQCIKVSYL